MRTKATPYNSIMLNGTIYKYPAHIIITITKSPTNHYIPSIKNLETKEIFILKHYQYRHQAVKNALKKLANLKIIPQIEV